MRALAWIETDGKPYLLESAAGVGHLTVTDKTFEYIQQSLVKRTLDRANPTDNLEAGIAYVAAMLKWGGEEPKGLAAFLQGPGSVRTNGIRPAIEEQVKRIMALRDRLKQGLPAPTTAGARRPRAAGCSGAAAQQGATAPAASGPGAGRRTAQTAPISSPSTASAGATAAPAAEQKVAVGENTANVTARAISAARAVAGANARIGISGRNLMTGERLDVDADQSFPAASVGKLALLVEAYRQTSSGSLTLNEVSGPTSAR